MNTISHPNYIDTEPLPTTAAKWKYRAIYTADAQRLGQWSNFAKITARGNLLHPINQITMATKKSASKSSANISASNALHHIGSGSNNPDNKPEIKQFIQSPNRSSRNGASITMVVVHCTEASLASTLDTFQDGSHDGRQVSAHYVIDRNGDIYQMVTDHERANHCKGANSNSVGIEHVASMTQPLTAAQSSASATLVRWLLQQYDIPAARVFGHDFAPGYSGDGTTCPDALFGAHTQQSVRDWVNSNVITTSNNTVKVVQFQPEPGSRLSVTASALNVRLTPSVQGRIVGSLGRGEDVGWLETSSDQYWAKIQNSTLTGWASRRFLVPPAINNPANKLQSISAILDIAMSSAIARHNWAGRGVAPLGYIKGMALVYGRLYCKLKAGDPIATEMARANSGNGALDALAHYAQQFHEAGMDNDSSGVSTLRHLIVLMIGLGMRESSGRYCEGLDRSASNTGANTAEAGMFQTSYNARSAHGLMTLIYQQYQTAYQTDPATSFVDIFKEGVNCTQKDWQNYGTGAGKDFQELSKKCPAFAAEFCGLGLRNIRTHWGPINNHAAEIRPECNQMLTRVEQVIESAGLCPI